jgi:sialate O-acetylesterase
MKRLLRYASLFVLFALAITGGQRSAKADVKLPAIFSDHMVLQQGQPVMVWGWAEPGEDVTVQIQGGFLKKKSAFSSDIVKTTTSADGKWSVKLAKLPDGAHRCTLKVTGENKIQLKDVLVGEVWVCSGQSNMQWSVTSANNPKEEIAAAKYPNIRLFYVPRVPSGTPKDDVKATWKACSPQTVGGFSAVSYFFGRHLHKNLNVPIGLIHTSWGGTRIEPWTPPVGFQSVPGTHKYLANIKAANKSYADRAAVAKKAGKPAPRHPLNSRGAPTGLYNGMIHPLVPFAIKGAIWYQGESNRNNGLYYEQQMQALINGWRKVWNQGDFPFYYVQLAPFRYRGDVTLLPKIWEAQTNVLKMKNTGMAVIVDIGNPTNIHPKNKQGVGKRLALWALAKTYGKKDLVYSGPLYKSMEIEGGSIRLTFDHVGDGLVSRNGKSLSHFSIAGSDGKFVEAKAEIDGSEVVVSSDAVKKPTAVRFGWHQLAEPNLSNKNGLPASPFRTDQGK